MRGWFNGGIQSNNDSLSAGVADVVVGAMVRELWVAKRAWTRWCGVHESPSALPVGIGRVVSHRTAAPQLPSWPGLKQGYNAPMSADFYPLRALLLTVSGWVHPQLVTHAGVGQGFTANILPRRRPAGFRSDPLFSG
jgi:hypothetical protein